MSEIPEDVMVLAEEAYQRAIYMTTEDDPKTMVEMVARAIMAERERCAKVADDHEARPNLLPLCSSEMNQGAQRGQYEAAEEIAAAIRATP